MHTNVSPYKADSIQMFSYTLFYSTCTYNVLTLFLPKKALGSIKQLHGLMLSLKAGSGLVSSY